MWIFGVCLAAYLHVVLAVESDVPVKVICKSCSKDKDNLAGNLGGNLSLQYTIVGAFNLIEIYYNNSNKISMNTKVINGKDVKDNRIQFSSTPIKSGNSYSIEITLNRLTLADDKLKFTYKVQDTSLNERSGSNAVTVIVGPSFSKQPEKELSVELSNKFHVEFSLRSNPKPNINDVTAKLGEKALVVTEVKGSGPSEQYVYDYKVDGGILEKDSCGAGLTITATTTTGKTISAKSDVKLLFKPDVPQNVQANRDVDNTLTVTWSPLKYGKCPIIYHVRYTQNKTIDNRVQGLTLTIHNAVGNITVAVNAEVNHRNGEYSEPITIFATDPPTVVSPRGKGNSEGLEIEYIIAIVVIVVLIILILAGVCFMRYKKGQSSANDKHYDVDMQPLSQIIPEPDYEFPNVIGKKPAEPQMIYAELGPSGGRTGEKPKIEQSNYAEVKTEGVHYPNIQQSYRPASRASGRSQRSQQRQLIDENDDNSFGHESSIVV